MVRWIILAVLVVVVAATVPLAISYLPADVSGPVPARPDVPTGPPPLAVIEEDPTHDFGLMSEQDEGSKGWVIRNEGEGPLSIKFVEKPCTCTEVRLGEGGESLLQDQETVIEPGEQAEIVLTWETRDRVGEFSTFARFATNDYEHNPTFTLTTKGLVAPAVVVSPPRFDFSAAPSDEETTLSAIVHSPTQPEMALTAEPKTSRPGILVAEARPMTAEELERFNAEQAEIVDDHVHAEGEPDHHEGEHTMPEVTAGFVVSVTLKPGLPLGRFSDAVTLQTDNAVRRSVEIPISGQIVGPISAMPERVYLPGVSSSAGRTTAVTLNVRDHDRTRFSARIPEALIGIVEVAVEPAGTAAEGDQFRQYRMEVRVPKGAKAGIHRGTVVLETDHPHAEEVKVPVEVIVRGG